MGTCPLNDPCVSRARREEATQCSLVCGSCSGFIVGSGMVPATLFDFDLANVRNAFVVGGIWCCRSLVIHDGLCGS